MDMNLSHHLDMNPEDLVLNIENDGNHATFFNLDIDIENDRYVYKLYDKRNNLNFKITKMPYLSSNIPSRVFYSAVFSECLRIMRCNMLYKDFILKIRELYSRMKYQVENRMRT